MLGQSIHRFVRRVTLLHRFSVLSALVLILIAVLLGWRVQGIAEDDVFKQETAVAIAQAETLVHTNLLPNDITHPLAPAVLQRLAAYTRQSIAAGLFVRLKIWNSSGTIVYSDVPSLIGQRFSIEDDLDDILSGRAQTSADISDLTGPENVSERGHFSHLLEVYVPIHVQGGDTGRIIGAYELYHDLRLLDRQEADLRRAIWSSVAIGFLTLYISLFLVVHNASRRLVRQSKYLEYQALHDPLTGLPNRVLLQQRLQYATHAALRHHSTAALLLLDLDGFKEVNDTFGHPQGDTLLVAVAERLKGSVHAGDTVARLGGDEFAILLSNGDMPAATGTGRKPDDSAQYALSGRRTAAAYRCQRWHCALPRPWPGWRYAAPLRRCSHVHRQAGTCWRHHLRSRL